ncbi:MAG: hypothetical protein QXL17_02900 [Candidatus Thermoplasmatota archaeon]
MHNPITVLEKYCVNTQDYTRAVQDVRVLWSTGKQYRDAIVELVGDVSEVGSFDDLTAKYFYLYLVQNIVRNELDPSLIVNEAFQSALKMVDRLRNGDMQYALGLEDNAILNGAVAVNENGETVSVRSGRKGEKKDRAIQLYSENKDKLSRNEMIELFMKELDMSKAGATTYVYNCKKEVN